MTYFKYVERSAEDNINWAEVGKNMSDMLQQEAAAREAKKAQLDKDSREYGERLSNSPSGTYDGANTFISEYADSQQEYRLLQDRLFQSGQLSLRDYTRNRQNNIDGTDIMFDLAKEYEAEFVEKMERYKLKKSSYQEVFKMEQAEGLANLRQVGAYINPTNGVVSIGKKVTTGEGDNRTTTLSTNPNDVVTVPQLRNRIKQKIDRMDIAAFSTGAVEQLGAIEESVVQYASKGNLNTILTEINATKGVYGVEGDNFAAGYLEWEKNIIGEGMVNPNDAASILVDTNTIEPTTKQAYTFSDNPNPPGTKDKNKKDIGRKANEIYLNPDLGPTGDGTPDLTQKQREAAEEVLKIRIRGAIDQKVSIKGAGFTPKDNATDISNNERLEKEVDIVTEFSRLFWDNEAGKTTAAAAIRAFNPAISSVKPNDDGTAIIVTYGDTNETETIELGDNEDDFIKRGLNFVLPDKFKIANINEVVKRGGDAFFKDGQRISRTPNAITGFESVGGTVAKLPFNEAFLMNEGSKVDIPAVLEKAGTNIKEEETDAAVTLLQSQLSGIPGLNTVSVTDFTFGQGVNITVPATGKQKAINLSIDFTDAANAKVELEKAIQTLLNYAANRSTVIQFNTPEKQEAYVDSYGKVRTGNDGSTVKVSTKVPRKTP